jgi:mRNA interferase MazF
MTPFERGDIVTVAAAGYAGKPRPALVVQADLFNPTHASVTVCLMTSERHDAPLFRVPVVPSRDNGVHVASDIMVDKIATIRRDAVGRRVGRLDATSLAAVDRALRLWLSL